MEYLPAIKSDHDVNTSERASTKRDREPAASTCMFVEIYGFCLNWQNPTEIQLFWVFFILQKVIFQENEKNNFFRIKST